MNIQILDNSFRRLAIMTPHSDQGLTYYDDKLTTSIKGGVYNFDFRVDKKHPDHEYIKEGNMLAFKTPKGIDLLMTIMKVDEYTKGVKVVYTDDTTLNLINKVVEEQLAPKEEQPIEFYINNILMKTGWEIGLNESEEKKILEYPNTETALARINKIIEAFGMEHYFETEITPPDAPDFKLHIVKERIEDEKGFRVSSDDLLDHTGRQVSINNITTRLIVRGNEIKRETTTTEDGKAVSKIAVDPQPVANKYDASKRSGATPVSTSGWSQAEVDQFRMNQADPPYVNGTYIDAFLRKYYPDSPLIGHGDYLKKSSDYWGVSVGAALGCWAKETTFGRARPGTSPDFNFGCIRYTSNNQGGFGSTSAGGSLWTSYGTVENGINAWMWLLRYGYIETGQVYYRDFLNKYSPSFENNQATFKNLMWGVLKSFGYAMPDTALKKNYSQRSDNPRNVNINIPVQYAGGVGVPQTTTAGKSVHEDRIDKMIQWFQDRKGKVRYSMQSRNGPNSYDCSSAVYSALKYAGFKTNISWLGSTVSLWGDIGSSKLMVEIPRNQARRGDIFLSGPKGSASAGASGHTGVFLDNNTIIHCNYADNGISVTPVSGRAGSPLYCFRLNNKDGDARLNTGQSTVSITTTNPDGISDKMERAVQRALSQVGGRYVWGGTAYRANDCSGLIYESYRHAGFPINHRCTTSTIQHQTYPFKKISKAEARRGDLAITNGGGHVEILLGRPGSGAGVVHAASPALGIITQKNHVGAVLGYYRVLGDEPAKGGGTASSGSTFTHYPTVPSESQLNHMYASPHGYASHRGIDIIYTTGNSDIFSVADGIVTQTQNGCYVGNSSCGGGWGNHVIIKHNNGYHTVYAHLTNATVSRGQSVKGGQKIGNMGNTGNSTGKHLHLEVLASNGLTKLNPNNMFDWSGYKSLFSRWWL